MNYLLANFMQSLFREAYKVCLVCEKAMVYFSIFWFSFAQWQYRSQWRLTEARLLLIENYTQYPAFGTWNIVPLAISGSPYGGQ